MKATIFEAVSMGKPSAIDRAAHVIRGVKILGLESANGRAYPRAVIERAKSQYEGRRVYVDHVSADNPKRSRSYTEQIGVIRSPAMRDDGLYGDFHFNPKHPTAEQMLHDAEHNPDMLGFSHHADIDQKSRGGKMTVESIYRVRSVDLVCEPATTAGLFESKESDTMPKTLKEVLEAAKADGKSGALQILEDMMAGGSMAAEMPVDAPSDGGADGQIKAAFRSAVIAAFDDDKLDSKATLAKIKDVLNAYDKLTGKSGGGDKKDAPAPASEGGSEKKESLESLQAQLTAMQRRDEVRGFADKHNVKLTDVQLRAAVALESVADREAFVKELPKLTGGGSSNDGRPARSPSINESKGGNGGPLKPLQTGEEILEFLRG